jgi:glycosyltransferase involved in cell wall biosynthesis
MALESHLTVSVVIPLFNKVDHIRPAIQSVLAQSRPPEEVLVIDDGSTDGGDRVVQEYAPSVSLIRRPNGGVSAARNFGIEIAKGNAIAFLDGDDVWKPRFLERVTALLDRFPQACAAGSGYEFLTKPGQISQFHFAGVPRHPWEGIIDYFACLASSDYGAPPLHASGVIGRRAVLRQIGGFPLGVRWGEDHDTWARLALAGDIAFTNDVLFIVNIIATNRATDDQSPRPLLPAAATVAEALTITNDDDRRKDLEKYLKRLVFNSATINLRYSHSSLARKQLIRYRPLSGIGPRWFALMFCSFLPHPVVRMLRLVHKVVVSWAGGASPAKNKKRAVTSSPNSSMNSRMSTGPGLLMKSELIRSVRRYSQTSAAARDEQGKDRLGLPAQEPNIERAIEEAITWLCRAQDHSRSQDGGVASHFSLLTGWSSSYPETTGYIIPTILAYARLRQNEVLRRRAKKMLDWLVLLQFPDGSFQGGLVDSNPCVPVAFNTGQILLGLTSGVREFGEEYRLAMCRAADWLVEVQDRNGRWSKHCSPFATPGPKTYHPHVALGLLEAARIEADKSYANAALANVRWALGAQRENGWFENCCLSDDSRPTTHTLGYTLRGAIEAYRFTEDAMVLKACQKTADGLLGAIRADGSLPGRIWPDWSPAAPWTCLTGNAQIAQCWLLLFQSTGEVRYHHAACAANRYVRRTLNLHGRPEIRGGIKGSFPVDGNYRRYEYLSWATKFFVDSNLLEMALCDGSS